MIGSNTCPICFFSLFTLPNVIKIFIPQYITFNNTKGTVFYQIRLQKTHIIFNYWFRLSYTGRHDSCCIMLSKCFIVLYKHDFTVFRM